MRNHILRIAIVIMFLSWMPSILRYIATIFFFLYWYRKRKKGFLSIIILCFIFLLRFQLPLETTIELPNSFIAIIQEIRSAYVIADVEGEKIVLYGLEDVTFHDQFHIEADCQTINSEKNFYLFDFTKYMKKRHITTSCFVQKASLLQQGNSIQARLYRHIKEMPEEESSWISTLLYGISDQEVSYFISSTGMHLSYLATLLTSLFSFWFALPLATCLSLFVISCIGYATIWKDSLTRILVFRLTTFLFPDYSKYDRLGIAMLITLFIMPYIGNELTFVLPVAFRLAYLFNIQKRKRFAITFGILIPIQFYYFYCINLIQVFFFPFLRKGYAYLYIMAFLTLFFPSSIFMELASYLNFVLEKMQKLSFIQYYIPNLIFLLFWFYVFFSWISYNRKKYLYQLCFLFLFTYLSPYLRPYMEVWMINVGQGDCIVISLPFQQSNIMIDVAGHKERNIPEDIVIPQLKAKGIKKIDKLILTHDDLDHSGGLQQLMQEIEVKEIIQKKNISAFSIGNFHFSFLLNQNQFSNANENSLILYFEAFNVSFLFMGDAGIEAENALLEAYPKLKADVLKVGHHGSNSSSSHRFIHQLHPYYSLISCGINNRYGHPHEEVVKRLQESRSVIMNTAEDGAISIKLTNFMRIYKTANKEFGIIRTGE